MEIIETDNYKKLLKHSLFIGMGTTAYCFLLKNGMVFKVFKDSYVHCSLFKEVSMQQRLEDINRIQNNSYIGPEVLVLQDGEVKGYLYPYIKAHTLKWISGKTTLSEIYDNLFTLLNDTKRISDEGFYLIDVHNRNILYDGNYYMIDLDKGHILENQGEYVYKSNVFQIYDTIYAQIFNMKPWEAIEFDNRELNSIYYKNDWVNEYYNGCMYEAMCKYTKCYNPTIRQMKKIPHKICHNEYYK